MIISASRRCDIPAFYTDWFFNRLRAGFVDVRNPFAYHRVSRVSLLPEAVTGFVFWTKNPAPMLKNLDRLNGFAYYFQVTLTAYGSDLEPKVPDKNRIILPAIRRLADRIGPERIIWRYDPILVSNTYTQDWHENAFDQWCEKLRGCTHRCTISFLDFYRNTRRHAETIGAKPLDENAQQTLACRLADIARKHHLELVTCAEAVDLGSCGVQHGRCVDRAIFEKLLGRKLSIPKDRNQRPFCGCSQSIDIGQYNTCRHGCLYCYANYKNNPAIEHDPVSSVIAGHLGPDDKIISRVR